VRPRAGPASLRWRAGARAATRAVCSPRALTPAGLRGGQVEQAQLAHLCTVMSAMHHRRAGYPFATLTDFASDGAGYPVFCLSPLAIHTRNIVEDPRCSLVVQLPGWTGLANARVTIFGDVFQLPPELQESAKDVFLQKQARRRARARPDCRGRARALRAAPRRRRRGRSAG
jgi:hypothetical protein